MQLQLFREEVGKQLLDGLSRQSIRHLRGEPLASLNVFVEIDALVAHGVFLPAVCSTGTAWIGSQVTQSLLQFVAQPRGPKEAAPEIQLT